MRIALDARSLYTPQPRGIARSLAALYHALAQVRPDWQVLAYHRRPSSYNHPHPDNHPLPATAVPRCIEMPGDRFDVWLNWRLPWAAWRDGAHLLHCPANHCPSFSPLPMLVTIHDLIPIDMADSYPHAQVRRFKRSIRTAARHAAMINCPSRYTADRLRQRYHPIGPVRVVPWAVQTGGLGASLTARRHVRNQYRLSRPFVLHFGARDPRKNTRRLLEAWSRLPTTLLRRCQLVVLGLDEQTLQNLGQWTRKNQLESTIGLHPFATVRDAAILLEDAVLLAYPSLSEGFGIPILEAFAAGTAVLTSNRTAMPEVAGPGAKLFDPTDADAITAALRELLEHPRLRRDLLRRGSRRLDDFTWQAAAETFARGIEATVGKSAPRKAA